MSNQHVVAYTDGACKSNPGPGGWGSFITLIDGREHEISGGEKETTNNRMEMMGVIETLKLFESRTDILIISDSKYIVDNIGGVDIWIARGWRGANKKPVKNQDLWQELVNQCQRHNVQFQWVKGHSGVDGNERADSLATAKAEEFAKHE